jgi:hypothetical protein
MPATPIPGLEEAFRQKYGTLTPLEKAFEEIGFRQGEVPGFTRTLKALFNPPNTSFTEPSFIENLENSLAQPFRTLKAVGNFGWNALKGFAGNVSNLSQAVVGAPMPGATDEYRGPLPGVGADPLTLQGVADHANYRLQRAGNALLMGLPDAMQKRVDKSYDEFALSHGGRRPSNIDEHVLAYSKGAASSVANDIFGWENVKNLLRGDREVGIIEAGKDDKGEPIFRKVYEPLDTQAAVDELGTLGMKLSVVGHSPYVRGTGPKGGASAVVFGKKNLPIGKVITTGELEAAKKALLEPATKKAVAMEAAAGAEGVPKAYDLLTPDAQAMLHLENIGLSRPQIDAIVGKVIHTDTFLQIASKSNDRVFKQISETLRQGAGLTDEQLGAFARDQRLTPAQTRTLLADAFEQTESRAGLNLQAISEVNAFTEAALTNAAAAGDMTAKAALKRLLSKKQDLDAYHGWVNTINNAVEGPRRALMVTQLATTFRNIRAQGMNAVSQMFGHLVSGTAEMLLGEKGNPGAAYGDLISDITTVIDRATPSQRKLLEDTLNNMPLIKNHIRGGSMFDLQQTLLHNEALRGLPVDAPTLGSKISAGLDHLSYWLNTFNRMQEFQFRDYFFQQRLEANLKAQGWKYGTEGSVTRGPAGEIQLHTAQKKSILQQVNEAIKDPEFAPTLEFKTAVAEAAEHALQQTFAADFNSSAMGAMLKVYKSLPGLTAIFPPYPRFLANQWRWQMERSPVNWFDLFDKNFRKDLMAGAADGFRSRQAARQLGKAMEGTILLNAAWGIQNSDAAGPKYYQLKPLPGLPQKNETGENVWQDWRDTQPFVTYLGMAHVIKSAINNTPINMSIDEWSDFVAGVRRLSDYPAFAIGEYIRNIKSDNPNTFITAFGRPIGSWFGSWFTSARMLNEVYGGLEEMVTGEPSKALEYPDTARQPITGQAQGNAAPWSMPARPDPYTGDPQRSEFPKLRQFTGTTLNTPTKFQELVSSTPGLQFGRLFGDHGSAEADSKIHGEIGRILNTRTPDGQLFGDRLAEVISGLNLAPKMQAAVITELFHDERSGLIPTAKNEVMSKLTPEEAPAFFELWLRSVPAVAREIARAKLQTVPLGPPGP